MLFAQDSSYAISYVFFRYFHFRLFHVLRQLKKRPRQAASFSPPPPRRRRRSRLLQHAGHGRRFTSAAAARYASTRFDEFFLIFEQTMPVTAQR